jgi:hypothetical protein
MPDEAGSDSRQIPACAELNSGKIPGVRSEGDDYNWNWLVHDAACVTKNMFQRTQGMQSYGCPQTPSYSYH